MRRAVTRIANPTALTLQWQSYARPTVGLKLVAALR